MSHLMKKIIIVAMIATATCCFLSGLHAQTKETVQGAESFNRPLSKEDVPNPVLDANPLVDSTKWEIKNGKFYLDGNRVFLKIGKPLINFTDATAVDKLIGNLDIYRQKYYTALELNCYWHHFDPNGDGEIEKSLEPLNKLIDAIYAKGMYPCLSVETYAVGGGTIPAGFWTRYPDADAIDSHGKTVNDTEYGFGSRVVSLFHPGYLETTRKYIRNLASGIDTRKILWFETSVEPQYMGTINLCYSAAAKKEYENWRVANHITDKASIMPDSFPIPESFIKNDTWNKFRAQWLAGWVNGEAAAYRDIAGQKAYVAVDFLDAGESEQIRRDGNPVEFLTHLTGADIIQVNWSWYFPSNAPNQKAYDRVREAMANNGKDWAVTEHMTFNGSDFVQYNNETLERILENTLANGTRLGWEFATPLPSSTNSFCLYQDDFSGKNVINIVDNYWGYWLYRVDEIEKNIKPPLVEGGVVTSD